MLLSPWVLVGIYQQLLILVATATIIVNDVKSTSARTARNTRLVKEEIVELKWSHFLLIFFSNAM